MLIISRKPGESFLIDKNIEITILETTGDKIKIGINAPKEIKIVRKELLETQNANLESSKTVNENEISILNQRILKKANTK